MIVKPLKEKPGNSQNKLQLTTAYKKLSEKKPSNPMQRFQDDIIVKDMMNKRIENRLLSPKKQMIDLSQVSKKDGRSKD